MKDNQTNIENRVLNNKNIYDHKDLDLSEQNRITTLATSKKKNTTKETTVLNPKIKANAVLKTKDKKNTTVNDEIIFCVENNLVITIALLSKRVGVSTHRIRKYCKSNFIDLEKINKNNYKTMLDPKRIKEIKKQEKIALENKKLMAEEQKKQDKLKKSLNKKNQTSSKHKMPIDTNNTDKLSINCNFEKIKLF